MSDGKLRVVLHSWRINGRVWADDSFVRALRADGFEVDLNIPEPEPPPSTVFHGDSVLEYLTEHIHVYLPVIGAWLVGKFGDDVYGAAKGAVLPRLKKLFVASSTACIEERPEFDHQHTLPSTAPMDGPSKRSRCQVARGHLRESSNATADGPPPSRVVL